MSCVVRASRQSALSSRGLSHPPAGGTGISLGTPGPDLSFLRMYIQYLHCSVPCYQPTGVRLGENIVPG